MGKYSTSDIRNIVFVGHGDSGKTTLADAILFKTGTVARQGRVEDGTSAFDFDAEEKERKISIDIAAGHASWKNGEVNMLDAPGYPDFVAEAVAGLWAAETAVVCINAAAGIMVNTRKIWQQCEKMSVPRVILINKMDLENIDVPELLGAIDETFGHHCIPVNLPVGSGAQFKGVTSLLSAAAAKNPEMEENRKRLMEAVVEVEDSLMEQYLEKGEISKEQFEPAFRKAIAVGKVVPILFTSVRKDVGMTEFLDFVVEYLPSPKDLPRKGRDVAGEAEKVFEPTEGAPFSAVVFKVTSEKFIGKLSIFRVLSGTLNQDSTFYNVRTKRTERVPKVFRLVGKDQQPAEKVVAGDIAAVTKINDIIVSDTLCVFPTPMVSLAAEPTTRGDEQKLSESLTYMAASDPVVTVARDRQTGDLVITGTSNLHLEIMLSRLKRRFDVHVTTKQCKIPYKETITGKADGHYRHKKQTGGRGQFAEVYLRVEPKERGSGFEFVDDIVGGSIPQNFRPAVEKGVRTVLETGYLTGCPMQDMSVSLYDGKYHDVDSSDIAFQIAGRGALKEALEKAKPMLLEPIVNIEITVPSKFMGDITGDINSRRGRILGMDSAGGQQVVRAQVPLAEISTYSQELRSRTAGEGYYSVEFSHYDVVPMKVQEAVVARYRASKKDVKEEE
jgi:elongation factor G